MSSLCRQSFPAVAPGYFQALGAWREREAHRLVLLSRVVIALLVVCATALGLYASDLVFWLVLFAWAGLGAALGPPSILALYWRKTTRAGIIAGLLTGTAVTIAWKLLPQTNGLLHELVPAFLASTVATVVISLITDSPSHTDEMFATMRAKGPPGQRHEPGTTDPNT